MLKVCTIIGTRPEIIRLSRIINNLDIYSNHLLIHTGQNFDYELNEIFFKELDIRKPDYFLGVKREKLGETLGAILQETEKILIKESPDAVLILGDTNSSLSSIIAKRLKIPIYHLEAGNRCFDLNVPEEINRKIVDHISDFNLVYTELARKNLLKEGLPQRRIYKIGSPLKEVIDFYLDKINSSKILNKLSIERKKYFLASLHREENVDNPSSLKKLIMNLNKLVEIYDKPLILSVHPRTKNNLSKNNLKTDERIILNKPFGFFDYANLQINAICTISDSGTISEEASILNFPAISPRDSIERPEALENGSVLTSPYEDQFSISEAVEFILSFNKINKKRITIPEEYKINNTSERVIKLIISTAKLSNKWDSIRTINN